VQFEPGEQVFFHGHPSWRSIIAYYVRGVVGAVLVGAVVGLVTAIVNGHVQAGWIAVGVIVTFFAVLIGGLVSLISTTYSITSRRLTIQSGILRRELHETRLERVQNVNTVQSLLQRILRIGTVDFDTAAGAEYDFKFRGVSSPRTIVRTVDRAIHELQAAGAGSLPPAAGV
jgi:uncharacterized membrane protein YdbT with pleckstrin-like domain